MELKTSTPIPDKIYFSIGDVSEIAGVKPYVLRYWESQFSVLHPEKSRSQRRQYRRKDVENVLLIKHLLYNLKYSIEGARQYIQAQRKKSEPAPTSALNLNDEAVAALTAARGELLQLIELCQR